MEKEKSSMEVEKATPPQKTTSPVQGKKKNKKAVAHEDVEMAEMD